MFHFYTPRFSLLLCHKTTVFDRIAFGFQKLHADLTLEFILIEIALITKKQKSMTSKSFRFLNISALILTQTEKKLKSGFLWCQKKGKLAMNLINYNDPWMIPRHWNTKFKTYSSNLSLGSVWDIIAQAKKLKMVVNFNFNI